MSTRAQQIIDDLNYFSDARVTAEVDNGEYSYFEGDDEIFFDVPFVWDVCGLCNGEGKHVNPSVDAGGLSSDDFNDDPEFAEDYFGGVYDVTCNRCNGRTTVRVPNWDAVDPEIVAKYRAQQDELERDRQIHLAEILAGA